MPYLLLFFIIDGVAAIATQNTNPCGINKDSSILFYSILVTMCNNHTAKHQQKNVIAEEKKKKTTACNISSLSQPSEFDQSIFLFCFFQPCVSPVLNPVGLLSHSAAVARIHGDQ